MMNLFFCWCCPCLDRVKNKDDLEGGPDELFVTGDGDGDGRRVGIEALDAGAEAPDVGVEGLATVLDNGVVDLVGPADLEVAVIVDLFKDKLF